MSFSAVWRINFQMSVLRKQIPLLQSSLGKGDGLNICFKCLSPLSGLLPSLSSYWMATWPQSWRCIWQHQTEFIQVTEAKKKKNHLPFANSTQISPPWLFNVVRGFRKWLEFTKSMRMQESPMPWSLRKSLLRRSSYRSGQIIANKNRKINILRQ